MRLLFTFIACVAVFLPSLVRGQVNSLSGNVYNAAFGPDGKVYVSTSFVAADNQTYQGNVRLNSSGGIDNTYTPDTSNPAYSIGFFNDGSYLANGVAGIQKYTAGGILVDAYPSLAGARTLTFTSDGSSFYTGTGKYSANGSLIFSYASSFEVLTMAIQTDGKILLGGASGQLIRLNSTGTLDSSFSAPSSIAGGNVHGLSIQSDGKIVVSGASFASAPNLFRLDSTGAVDLSFSSTLTSYGPVFSMVDGRTLVSDGNNGTSIGFDASGRIVTAGTLSLVSASGTVLVGQLILDPTFNQTNGVSVYQAIPEPATIALIAGAATLVFATVRSRVTDRPKPAR